MSVSVTSFREAYPDFRGTSTPLIAAKIKAAKLKVAPRIWGTRADEGVMLYTAHLLSISPSGEQSRLKLENRGTEYKTEFEEMRRAAAFGVGRNT